MAKPVKKGEDNALPSMSLVFGYIAVKELQKDSDRVRVLARLGYGNDQISRIIGKSPGAVAVMKVRLKMGKS